MTDVSNRAPLSALVGPDRCCDLPPDRMAKILHALAHPVRLQILRQIRAGGITPTSLSRILLMPQDQIARHIFFLKQASLIGTYRHKGSAYYRIFPQRCSAIGDLLDLTLKYIDVPSENIKNGKRVP